MDREEENDFCVGNKRLGRFGTILFVRKEGRENGKKISVLKKND